MSYPPDYMTIRFPKVIAFSEHDGEADEERPHDLLMVSMKSCSTNRKAVETIAYYFRRELHFDFLQYEAGEGDPKARLFCWVAPSSYGGLENRAIGACCFRWRTGEDALPAGWALVWVWIHPYFRNHGHLTTAWPYFKAKFGDFVVEHPLSPAMAAFLEHREAEHAS